jgi:hypothetical protein
MITDLSKFVIVFDIDGIICRPQSKQLDEDIFQDQKYFHMSNPECPAAITIQNLELQYIYYFPPYLDVLFRYLINSNCRIVFFSAANEARNTLLLTKLLTNIMGSADYQQLKSSGQFNIFSSHHLTLYNKKDISIVLNEHEDLNNSVLIDDQVQNALENTACISAFNLYSWEFSYKDNDSFFALAKNNAYYLLGIFINYFNNQQNLSLKDWLIKININKKYLSNISTNFVQEMISLGLDQVKQYYPDAIFYGKRSFKLLEHETHYNFSHPALII